MASKKGVGIHKECVLSDELAELLFEGKRVRKNPVGEVTMTRPQVNKAIWAYIKDNDLQNPSNRREIIADPALKSLFGKSKFTMFQLATLLNDHLS